MKKIFLLLTIIGSFQVTHTINSEPLLRFLIHVNTKSRIQAISRNQEVTKGLRQRIKSIEEIKNRIEYLKDGIRHRKRVLKTILFANVLLLGSFGAQYTALEIENSDLNSKHSLFHKETVEKLLYGRKKEFENLSTILNTASKVTFGLGVFKYLWVLRIFPK